MALLGHNNIKKKILAKDVEGLIKVLTGFEESDKNYQEVERFVFSNILHHNFATADIGTIQKSVEGIAEKFKIHSLSQRAKRFQELVNKYVNSDSSQHSQLNVQWHVLLLLLKLSYRPTSISEDALKAEKKKSEPSIQEEEVKWSEYLKEGWEDFQCPTDSSDEDDELWLSSIEDDKEEAPACNNSQRGVTDGLEMSGCTVPHPSNWQPLPPPPSGRKVLQHVVREGIEAEDWLATHVQNSWWSDVSCSSIPESKYPPAHTCHLWERCVDLMTDSSPLQLQMLSEFKVLHEVLWLLQVSTDTCLFGLDDSGLFYVKPNLSLPSTIPDTLHVVLEDLCPYFNMINKLKKFEEELSKGEMSDNPPPVTYKAYCAALFQQLHKFKRLIIGIETKLNMQEETMTLLSVLKDLMPGLNILQYLFDLHCRAVTNWCNQPHWLCATRLLSVMYQALLETSDQMQLEAALDIFIHSFHVYLDIIDVWLSEGRLEDWRNEFLVTRDGGSLKVMPYEEEMHKCGVVPVSLLTKLVAVVRDAGNTMEVVSRLNKLPQLRHTVHNKGDLFKEFSENVYNEIKRLKENAGVKSAVTEDHVTCISPSDPSEVSNAINDTEQSQLELSPKDVSMELSPKQGMSEDQPLYLLAISDQCVYDAMMGAALDNPLLTKALSCYLESGEPNSPQPSRPATYSLHCHEHDVGDGSVSLVGLMSLHGVLERQLELIISRHRTASLLVTHTLRTDYSLLQHFTVLRNVFFMEAGNLAQSFYSYLFIEIESGTWNNSLSMSVQLQLCVEEYYPGFGNFFTVLIKSKSQTNDVHQAIPYISLAYRVDWPVSSIITPDAIDSYNKVFRFLLHLKYASWTLHNLRFSDLDKSHNTLRVRRLHVLRLWMYHSTNTVHAYFMGLVLRSFSTHLDHSIRLADTINEITTAHNKYLDEVKVHCLQDKKSYVETFIMKLLRLCSLLSDHWQLGEVTEADLRKVEEQYMAAYRGLVHCLDVLTTDTDNTLCELQSEFTHSLPEPCYVKT